MRINSNPALCNFTRRFISTALLVVLAKVLPDWLSAAEPIRPNIIVILADDQGYADLGVQGQVKDIRTPNLDALAASGVRCTAGYDTAPQCSPSRAGLLTGRYQQRFGFDTIPDCPLPLEETTLANRLHSAGYTCGMVGKWHLDPNPTSKKWMAENMPDMAGKPRNQIRIPQWALLKYSAGNRGFQEYFQGETEHYWANFDLAGKPLAPGGHPENRSENLPLRDYKWTVYEGGIRVPFIAAYPGVFPAGLEFSNPVCSFDIFPTVAALTGTKAPANLDGVNLTPYLKGEKTTAPHEDLFFSQDGMGGVRQGQWKLVMPNGGAPQLFDVSKDVEEKRDLAAGESACVKELTAKWQAWNAQMPPPSKNKRPKESGKKRAAPMEAENDQ